METDRSPEPINALLDSLMDGFIILAADATVLGANSALTGLLGKSPDVLLGRNLWTALPELIGTRFETELQRTLTEGGRTSFSLRMDGGRQQLAVRIHRHLNGLAVQLRDVSDERAIAERIERNEAMLAMAQRIARLGAWRLDIVDGSATTLNWSVETFRIHGIEPTVNSIPIGDAIRLVHTRDRKRLLEEVSPAIQRSVPFEAFYRIVRPSGEIRHLHLLGSPEADRDAKLIAVHGSIQDVTESHRMRQALARTEAQLAASQRDLTQCANLAYHDLQEPLRKLQTLCDLLLDRATTPHSDRDQLVDLSSRIASASGRMQLLVNDLQHFLKAHTEPVIAEPISLGRLLEQIAERFFDGADKALTDIELDDQAGIVRTDYRLLAGIVANLIENAVKYRHPDRPLRIRVLAETFARDEDGDDPWLRLSFVDNGSGFDSRHAGRIFDPFQKLEGRSASPGSGMGLTLARSMAERLGGTIRAEGRPGMGATFTVELPLRSAPAPES
ncbi:MAG: ATP-binding protein [Xanthomonadaceae bacterium]|nr:ATP-binding protein [Xanthomonadaceae bacterium]